MLSPETVAVASALKKLEQPPSGGFFWARF